MITSLIALVPICTLAFTFVHDKLEVKKSDLTFSLINCSEKHVEVFASNKGNRDAIFTGAEFFTYSGADLSAVNEKIYRALGNNLSTEKKVIRGGETRSIMLSTTDNSPAGLVPFDARQSENCEVNIRLHRISFDQTKLSSEVKCACPRP